MLNGPTWKGIVIVPAGLAFDKFITIAIVVATVGHLKSAAIQSPFAEIGNTS